MREQLDAWVVGHRRSSGPHRDELEPVTRGLAAMSDTWIAERIGQVLELSDALIKDELPEGVRQYGRSQRYAEVSTGSRTVVSNPGSKKPRPKPGAFAASTRQRGRTMGQPPKSGCLAWKNGSSGEGALPYQLQGRPSTPCAVEGRAVRGDGCRATWRSRGRAAVGRGSPAPSRATRYPARSGLSQGFVVIRRGQARTRYDCSQPRSRRKWRDRICDCVLPRMSPSQKRTSSA